MNHQQHKKTTEGPWKPGAHHRRALVRGQRRAVRVVLASRDVEQLDNLPTIERSHRG